MIEKSDSKQRKGIQSVEIGLKVLGAFVGIGRPSSLSEIAKASDLSLSQTHRYLASFVNMRYLRQDPETLLYDLHTGALRLGLASLARLDVLAEAGRIAQDFVQATNRTALLSIWSELGPTIIRWFPGNPPVYTTLAIGSRLSLTSSATGLVFLAFQHEAYISKLLKEELAQTKDSIKIASIKKQVRQNFVTDVDGTVIPGLRAMAAPVFDLQEHLTLVISTVASESFAAKEDRIVQQRLIGAAQEITHRIGGRWPKFK